MFENFEVMSNNAGVLPSVRGQWEFKVEAANARRFYNFQKKAFQAYFDSNRRRNVISLNQPRA